MGAAKSKVTDKKSSPEKALQKQKKLQAKNEKKQRKRASKGDRKKGLGKAKKTSKRHEAPANPPGDAFHLELEPVFENEYLPQPNVMPLTIFEMEEMRRAQCNPESACNTFEKIHLPPIDYYGRPGLA